jgi:hypothetical protein
MEMHPETDRRFRDEDKELLKRENTLRHKTHAKQDVFANNDARRHFKMGVVLRHYMLQASRLFLSHHCTPQRTEPLTPDEATACAVHLNAYYLNLRGTLDNLAWVLQYEWRLLGDVTEDSRQGRMACTLFGKDFLKALKPKHAALASVLEQCVAWARELADLRDPAAHRVPIYVPPGGFTSPEQVDAFNRIMAQADVPLAERGEKSFVEIYLEAQEVTRFSPIMILSTRQGVSGRPIHGQVRADHDKYLMIAGAVVDAL